MSTLHDINTLAADALEEHGWTQDEMEARDGSMCLVGALRHCSPQPGDWLIARAVYRHLGHDEEWNDAKGRTAEEVTAWLRAHPVTDADLEATFGPQWEAIVRLIRQAATLTQGQAHALRAAAVDAAWNDDAGVAAWDAAWGTASAAARIDASASARTSAREATSTTTGAPAGIVAATTADALVVADLVGQHGLTQDHIDTLLAPWVSVMGDPRDGVEVGS